MNIYDFDGIMKKPVSDCEMRQFLRLVDDFLNPFPDIEMDVPVTASVPEVSLWYFNGMYTNEPDH